MKINNVSVWNESLKDHVHVIATNAGWSGAAAKYYTDASTIYFFRNGQQNPSVAKIIAHDELQKHGVAAKFRFFSKYNSNAFKADKREFEDTFANLYPKTGDLRQKLINKGRISLDKVKSKASKFEKFLIGGKP